MIATLLSLLLIFTPQLTKLQMIEENMVQIEPFLTIAEADPEEEEADQAPAMHLWGTCRITHYCPCAKCCGKADGIAASGVPAQVNHTVACDLSFGTKIMINGQTYVVEDRGVSGMWVDIFVAGHQEAWDRGEYWADVYIIDE